MRVSTVKINTKLLNLFNMGSGRVMQALLSFLIVTVLARELGPDQLGIYSIVLAIFAYGSHVSEFGMRSIVIRDGNLPNKKIHSEAGLYICLRLITATLVSVSTYFVGVIFFPEYAVLAGLVMISTFFIAMQLDWLLLVSKRYLAASWVLVIRPIFYLAAVLLLVWFEQVSLIMLILAFVSSWGALAIFSWIIVGQSVPKFTRAGLLNKKGLRLLKEGYPILGVALVGQAIQSADLIWIGGVYGVVDAGHYYVASAIIVAAMVFANAMTQISLGEMSKYIDDKGAFSKQLKSDISLILWVGVFISIGLIYIISPLIPMVFGYEYKVSGDLIVYFVPYFFLSHVTGILYSSIIVIGKQKQLLRINIVRAFLLLSGLFIVSYSDNLGYIALMKALVELVIVIVIRQYYSYGYLRGILGAIFWPGLIVAIGIGLRGLGDYNVS
ncbi:MAG: hypothetical protein COB22_02335 [Cycloclasticus sp.]|nr:MAG: hypothetical protein COB22_02335 [Cycloclasticus sp.]